MTRAFVLSGGASLGAVQVGMLHALFERGIAPDLIVGTSAGAINGAFIASRDPSARTAAELAGIWHGLRRGEVFPTRPLTGLLGFLGRSDHLVPGGALRRVLQRNVQTEYLEDMRTPLHVVATDVVSGSEVRLSEGSTVDAVMASAAIPGVFAPVEIAGCKLIDGGVSDNTPISHAVALGAQEIYVLPTGYACALPRAPRGALAMLLHAMSLLVQQRLHLEVELYAAHARLVVMPPPCPLQVQPIDFSRARELIEQALSGSREFLASLEVSGMARDAIAPSELLVPHRHDRARST